MFLKKFFLLIMLFIFSYAKAVSFDKKIDINKKLNKNLLFYLIELRTIKGLKLNFPKIYIEKEYSKDYRSFIYLIGINYLLKYHIISNQKELDYILKTLFKTKYFDFKKVYISFLYFYLKSDLNKTLYYASVIKERSLSLIKDNMLGYIYLFILSDLLERYDNIKLKKYILSIYEETTPYLVNNKFLCTSIYDNLTKNFCYLEYYDNYDKLIKKKKKNQNNLKYKSLINIYLFIKLI